jgi:chromosome segregation ATPase
LHLPSVTELLKFLKEDHRKKLSDYIEAARKNEATLASVKREGEALSQRERKFAELKAQHLLNVQRDHAEINTKARAQQEEFDRREHDLSNREQKLAAAEKAYANRAADLQRRVDRINQAASEAA